jgi:hypothetical protein
MLGPAVKADVGARRGRRASYGLPDCTSAIRPILGAVAAGALTCGLDEVFDCGLNPKTGAVIRHRRPTISSALTEHRAADANWRLGRLIAEAHARSASAKMGPPLSIVSDRRTAGAQAGADVRWPRVDFSTR